MANTQPLKLINIARRYKHIRPVPRMPNFAAWIDGVDLTQPLTEPVQTELRQALWDFEVIFLGRRPSPRPSMWRWRRCLARRRPARTLSASPVRPSWR